MSRNIQTLTKWLPVEIKSLEKVFKDCAELEQSAASLLHQISSKLCKLKESNSTRWSQHQDNVINDEESQDFEEICERVDAIVKLFNMAFQQLKVNKSSLIGIKLAYSIRTCWLIKTKLCYFIHQLLFEMLPLFVLYGQQVLVLSLKISVGYNDMLSMDTKYSLMNDTSICTNTCPYLLFPLRKISVTRLLQILAMNRAEICCHQLMDCLLDSYKTYEQQDEDNGSDNSSIEIYMALTKHMTPLEHPTKPKTPEDLEVVEAAHFASLDDLLQQEAKYVEDFLNATLKTAPVMLGNDGVKKSKNSGESKISAKARAKVMDYYEQILWGEVGNYLEHIVLWWAPSPLSARPPHSTQHLREWINQFIPTADIPSVILLALSSLADALGVHVTSTSWDTLFRLALVATTTTCNPDTGKLFANVLQDLVTLSNQCEVTPDWIMGAPLDELPLVEQIPVLHRLDHSVHTTRLWAINESKKIANTWNVAAFFSVTHNDIVNCMNNLSSLRLSDHTTEIEKGSLGVHVEVCSLMRAKLASEVTVNVQKLKDSPAECVEGLASVCRTISLANLKMIFPPNSYWRQSLSQVPYQPSSYVTKFLDQILFPVLQATSDPIIANMILKLMCESWLDHIYMNKIKFSGNGAMQLLCDFDEIATWLNNCACLNPQLRKKLKKNEILKRCEGVGRLLMRNPGEKIAMTDKVEQRRMSTSKPDPDKEEKTELMPAEMYVPNQEQWLELRAIKKRFLFNPHLCCGNLDVK